MIKKAASKEKNKQIWFPAKKHGYGWSLPTAWQGWAILLSFVTIGVAPLVYVLGIYGGDAYCNGVIQQGITVSCDPKAEVGMYALAATFWLLAWILLLYHVCTLRGEPAKWRWTAKNKHAKKS